MANKHNKCRQDARTTLGIVNYKLQHLKDMIHDECPVMKAISLQEIDKLMDLSWEIRSKIGTCE